MPEPIPAPDADDLALDLVTDYADTQYAIGVMRTALSRIVARHCLAAIRRALAAEAAVKTLRESTGPLIQQARDLLDVNGKLRERVRELEALLEVREDAVRDLKGL